uniref:Uncharacterized protein n=1 Tax=viral metagenome TaxID=1070528 RepID=A0A6M3IZT6_9ZZZZ
MDKYKKCYCGCENFTIYKPGKQFILVCIKCGCRRIINTPNFSAPKYEVDIPFLDEGPENSNEDTKIKKLSK